MSKTNKKRDIIVFDPNSKKLYKLADNILSEASPKDKSALSYNISYMSSNDVMHTNVEVSNDSEEDEISIITNKTYEALGLDIEKDYKISYSISEASDGTSSVYNVFVVDNEKITTDFKDVVRKLQYIDYIDMEPLMYQSYYSSRIIDPSGVHVFIYVHKTYATLSVYKNGGMVDSKIITKFSIDSLFAAYCADLSEKIPEHIFLEELNKYGFDHVDNAKRISLNKVLSEAFRFVINNLTLILRGMQSDNEIISKVIVGTDIGLSSNLLKKVEIMLSFFKSFSDLEFVQDSMLQNKIGFETDGLTVDEFINIHRIKYDLFRNIKDFAQANAETEKNQSSKDFMNDLTEINRHEGFEISINPFVLLSFLRANEQLRSPNDVFNISPFLRPPPFVKRYSGKIILAIVGTIALASLYPLYNYAMGFYCETMKDNTNEEIVPKESEKNQIEAEIRSLENSLRIAEENLSQAKRERDGKYMLLNNIYDKKVNYLSKAAISSNITSILNKNQVKVTDIDIKNNNIVIVLKGSTTSVTNFLKDIGSNSGYIIESRELSIKKDFSKDDNLDGYESTVKIRVVK